jgi:hypothetical protein
VLSSVDLALVTVIDGMQVVSLTPALRLLPE